MPTELEFRFGKPIECEFDLIESLFSLQKGETLIELGCGPALTTRMIADHYPEIRVIGTDVDTIQYENNSKAKNPPNLEFQFGGAENIDMPDGSVDYVVMLKSLHHVPVDLMDQALCEIRRVLVPGGRALILEPIYEGEFNEILKIFNDEEAVRQAAIDSMKRAVKRSVLEFDEQIFFETVSVFDGFSDFEKRILGATHLELAIDGSMMARIKVAFERYVNEQGVAEFRNPRRVDMFRGPVRCDA